MSRKHVVLAALLALVVGAAAVFFVLPSGHHTAVAQSTPPAPASTTSIDTAYFSLPVPAGWMVRERFSAKGVRQFQLGSTKAPINALGIGPGGTVAVTITEYTPAVLAKGHIAGKPAESFSAIALLPFIVGQPGNAEGVQTGEQATPTTLDGAEAGEEAFFYGYNGRANLQVDVLAKHAARLFLIELDAEPHLQATSKSALAQILGGWRFR